MNLALYTVLFLACITSIESQSKSKQKALKKFISKMKAAKEKKRNSETNKKYGNEQSPENVNFFLNAGINTFLWIKKHGITRSEMSDNEPREAYLVILGKQLGDDVKASDADIFSTEAHRSRGDRIELWLKNVLETIHAGADKVHLDDKDANRNTIGTEKSFDTTTLNPEDQIISHYKDNTRSQKNNDRKGQRKKRRRRPYEENNVQNILNSLLNKDQVNTDDKLNRLTNLNNGLQKNGMRTQKIMSNDVLDYYTAFQKSKHNLKVVSKVLKTNPVFKDVIAIIKAYNQANDPIERRANIPLQVSDDDLEIEVVDL